MPKDFFLTGRWEDVDRARRLIPLSRYHVLGEESGEADPDNPYHHFHLFVQMKENWTPSQVLARVGVGINVQPRKGTVQQARAYVIKQGNFEEEGEAKEYVAGQGGRTDLAKFVEDAKVCTEHEMWNMHPSSMTRYPRAQEKVQALFGPVRDKVTEMQWIFGPPGCGKTLYVEQRYPDLYKKDKSQWWTGYTGQEVVLIDELNANRISYDLLLELGNGGPLRVQTKGGYVQFLARLVVIVSNVLPSVVYQEDLAMNDALLRRVRFAKASSAGPHRLQLMPQAYDPLHGWQDKPPAVEREVAYPDDAQYEYDF